MASTITSKRTTWDYIYSLDQYMERETGELKRPGHCEPAPVLTRSTGLSGDTIGAGLRIWEDIKVRDRH